MQIAIVGAGFTPEEADRLRRSLATFKKHGSVSEFSDRFIGGMLAKGYDEDFARRCFAQIEGFGSYGFPESHAASFALLVYASAWIKRHHPGIFACALLNSQPMGFYAPAQIVRDAREHGVTVLPPCIQASHWDNRMEWLDRPDEAARNWPCAWAFARSRASPRRRRAGSPPRAATATTTVQDVWRRAGVGPAVAGPPGRGRCLRRPGPVPPRRALGRRGAGPGPAPCRCLPATWTARASRNPLSASAR